MPGKLKPKGYMKSESNAPYVTKATKPKPKTATRTTAKANTKIASNSKAGARPTAEKIKTAITTKNLRDTVVFLDKNQPAFANKKNEAKNVRKKLDADKTAMRAKNIASRATK